jgi:protein-disulfide isomerase
MSETPAETPESEGPPSLAVSDEPPDAGVVRLRRSHLYAALIPLAFVAGLATGFLFWGRRGATQAAPTAQADTAGPTRFNVSADDDPARGPADAPITIIEFSDFNCPYCRVWHRQTFGPLLAAYPNQIRLVYRDDPITSQESFVAAQAADCAEEQGAFWPYHDALFSGRYPLGQEAYQKYAEEVGVDGSALVQCVESGRYAAEVENDARDAASLGVTGTPSFFINGIPLVGAQPIERFRQIIDAELSR